MPNPQPPEVGSDTPSGPVPADNQPGHHPDKEQDKPDLNAFAAKLGVVEEPEADGSGGEAGPVSRKIPTAALAGAVATLVALVLAIVVGRRRRNRR